MPRHAAGPALQIERLSVSFDTPRGEVQALREVSLEVEAGEVFGIAGESGSGKSTLAYAIMGDLAPNARVIGGTVRFAGDDLLRLAPGALRRSRGRRIAMVYQDPKSDLNHDIGAAILYISHDLAVIAQVSDRVGILYAGELVESAPATPLFHRPAHPYTRGLLDALPDIDLARAFRPIRGRLPDLTRLP